MYSRDASQVVTYEPDGTDARWLGRLGNVTGLTYSYVLPGGPDQLQCDLQCEPVARLRALEVGRIVAVYRGASRVWDGKLDQPTPSASGWAVAAHGAGRTPGDFMAFYTTGEGWAADAPVNEAISRGLRWVNPGISGLGEYLGQPQDSASVSLDSFLNAITQPANLTWYVGRGNQLSVFTPPTGPPTHQLLTSVPVARSLFGYYTQLWLRYQSSADSTSGSGTPAAYGTTSVQNAAEAAQHGQMEIYADLSSAGVMTQAAAQAIGAQMMARYASASFAGPFNVAPGQLLTTGGVPVDLGVGMPGPMLAQVLVASNAYGGEVAPAPPMTFLVGSFSFSDDTQSATISPFQYAANDLGTLLSNWVTLHPAPPVPATTGTPASP